MIYEMQKTGWAVIVTKNKVEFFSSQVGPLPALFESRREARDHAAAARKKGLGGREWIATSPRYCFKGFKCPIDLVLSEFPILSAGLARAMWIEMLKKRDLLPQWLIDGVKTHAAPGIEVAA